MVGMALRDLQAQRVSQAEFNDAVERAGKMRAAPTPPEGAGEHRVLLTDVAITRRYCNIGRVSS